MKDVILLEEVLPKITIYLVVGICVCLAFLVEEFRFRMRHKNQDIDKNLQMERQDRIISYFLIQLCIWFWGFIVLFNSLMTTNWYFIIPFFIMALGIVFFIYLLRK